MPDPQPGDELAFTLGLDGAVTCSVNNGPQRTLFHTDISLPTRPFIDLYGVAQKLQLLGVVPAVQGYTPCQPRTPSRGSRQQERPRSTCSPASLSSRLDMDSDLAAPTECVICYESGVDCVLYSCD